MSLTLKHSVENSIQTAVQGPVSSKCNCWLGKVQIHLDSFCLLQTELWRGHKDKSRWNISTWKFFYTFDSPAHWRKCWTPFSALIILFYICLINCLRMFFLPQRQRWFTPSNLMQIACPDFNPVILQKQYYNDSYKGIQYESEGKGEHWHGKR